MKSLVINSNDMQKVEDIHLIIFHCAMQWFNANNKINFLLYLLIPLFVTFFVTPLIVSLAMRYGCIDNPGKRRFHSNPTPRWGGIAFFLGIMPISFF